MYKLSGASWPKTLIYISDTARLQRVIFFKYENSAKNARDIQIAKANKKKYILLI